MKKKKPGISRVLSLLMALLIVVNLPLSAFAAEAEQEGDVSALATSDVPDEMLSSHILNSLFYLGYDSDYYLRNNGLLYQHDYISSRLGDPKTGTGNHLAALTGIPYANGGGTATTKEDGKTVPDVDSFKENGMVCTSFIEYYYLNYLRYIVGPNNAEILNLSKAIQKAYDKSIELNAQDSDKYPDLWSTTGDLLTTEEYGKVAYKTTLDERYTGSYTTQEYKDFFDKLSIGSLVQFGGNNYSDEYNDYIHYAVYAGKYNDEYYVIHVANRRGPEINYARAMENSSSKTSWPIAAYDFNPEAYEEYGSIEIYKDDPDGKPLAGAKFLILNTETGEDWDVTTDSTGYASQDELPLGTYSIREIEAPAGYELDDTVWTVELTAENPNGGGPIHVTNVPQKGSLQINKNAVFGTNSLPGYLAGWQFRLYKNSPSYTAQFQDGAIYRVKVTDANGNSTYSASAEMMLQAPATDSSFAITYQSYDGYLVEVGTRISLYVGASGSNLKYQWQVWTAKNGWTDLAGLTAPGVSITMTEEYRNSKLRAKVSQGDAVLYTAPITFATPDSFCIVNDLKPQVIGTAGSEVTLSVTANGEGLVYQWEVYDEATSKWKSVDTPFGGVYTTNDQGKVQIDGIPIGSYYVQEINTGLEGWTYDLTPKAVEIIADAATIETVTFINQMDDGDVTIQKITNTNDRLEGWIMDLYLRNEVGEYVLVEGSPFMTNKEGQITVEGLFPGFYKIVERANGSDYWDCDTTPHYFNVTPGKNSYVEIKNVVYGKLEIKKETTDGSPVKGYTFNVYGPDGALVPGSPFETDEDGYAYVGNMLPGAYIVEEILPEDSAYEVVGDIRKTVEVSPEETATVTFVNTPKAGDLVIQKETNTGKDLGGWKVNVYKDFVAPENLLPGSPFETDEEGKIVIEGLNAGVYVAVEVDDGRDLWIYDLEEKVVEVPRNDVGTVTIKNIQLGVGQIVKETTNGGSKAGWKFEVRDAAGTLIGTYTTGETGIITMELKPGTYTVTEISGGDEYWVADSQSTKTLTVVAGQTRSVKFINQWIGKGQIIKETTNGGSKAGWKFEVRDEAGELVGTYTTGDTGIITLNLNPGTYTVTELSGGDDYWVADPQSTKTLTVVAGETRSVKFLNRWIGKGQIIKETTNGGSKAGWKFEVRDEAGELVGTYTTGDTGIITMDLEPGLYIVTELSSGDDYWAADPESTKYLAVTAGQTSNVKFLNKWLGKGQIIKETTNGGSKAGWKFEIRDAAGALIGTYTTDETGIINLDLEPGTYTVTEIPGGNDYWVADSQITKTLTVVAGQTRFVKFLNHWIGKGQIIKETTNGGSKAGWKFEVRDAAGTLIGTYTTGETGIITMNLNPGTYTVTEISGGDGYWVADPQSTKTLVVTAGQTSNVKFLNKWLGKGQIIKDTTNGGSKAGWTFEVRGEQNELIGTYTTDETGIISLNLDPGSYLVIEVSGGNDYWEADPDAIKILDVVAGQTSKVEFLNRWLGIGKIVKETTNGGSKAGWKFEVRDAEGVLVGTYTTDETGIITMKLDPGTYSVTELSGGDGYWVADPQSTKTLVVTAGQTSSVKFLNKWLGKGQIIKETTNGGSKAGWKFEVRNEAGTLVGTYTTDESGIINLDLAPGIYTVTEISGGDGYWVADAQSTKTLLVTAGQTSSVKFLNKWLGKGQIIKETTNGGSKAGWIFEVLDANGDLVGVYTTDETGVVTLNLNPGTYSVTEIAGGDSYWVSDPQATKTLVVVAGQTSSVKYLNNWIGKGQIVKETTNNGSKAGWQFEIRDESGVLIGTYTTDETGIITFGLVPGTYTVTEIAGGDNYWVADPQATKTLVVVAGQTSSVQFLNSWTGKGQIIKEMADGSSAAGWKFEILGPNGKPIPGSPFVTDADGKITLDGLEPGTYTIRELIPDGSLYECVGNVQKTLTITAGQTASVRYVNALHSSSISIEKVDGNGCHLAGAKFLLEWSNDGGMTWTAVTLTNSPEPILGGCRTAGLVDGCLTTGEDGYIRFEGLYPGLLYRVTEVEAPKGYMLLADHAYVGELTTENLNVNLVVRNDAVIQMPMTGISSDNGTFLRVAFGTFCVIFVIMGIAIVKPRVTSAPN